MSQRVHILLTVRNRDLALNALLVFRTIRIGFPDSQIIVHVNGVSRDFDHVLAEAASSVGAELLWHREIAHGVWIERLLYQETAPFWICDTDIVFFEKVSDWFTGSDELFAGRYEPEFWEKWTGTVHVARLHPSLMWFNPQPLRHAMRSWPGTPEFFHTVELNLVRWNVVPRLWQSPLFYDTCAGLHQSLGGAQFSEEQNASFAHLFCGTYVDLMDDIIPNLRATHEAVLQNPMLATELWAQQKQWYKENEMKDEVTEGNG